MHIITVSPLATPPLNAGESTFEHYFKPLFSELKDCYFMLDDWPLDAVRAHERDILTRYRIAGLNLGRRLIYVYHGRRFLSSFGYSISDMHASVFGFTAAPDEQTLRSCTYDGSQLNNSTAARHSRIAFIAFEGAWTVATAEIGLIQTLSTALKAEAVLEETPEYLRGLIGLT